VKRSSEAKSLPCPLCEQQADYFCKIGRKGRFYYKCSTCQSVFLIPKKYVDHSSERARYEEHNNDVEDLRYQEFVSPITKAIQDHFPTNAEGLDYGCGTGPVASVVLEDLGYKTLALYDPFFQPDEGYLSKSYDYIICCEVMEHFYYPKKEFLKLRNLLKPFGKLFCKTSLLKSKSSVKEFSDWWYNNDPTHVFFYTVETLEYISRHFGFKKVKIEPKLITFS
jgi:SAM-dependent methyltransferase